MPPHNKLPQLEARYPLPCTNHQHLYMLVAQLLDYLKDTYDFSYVANPDTPKVKSPLKLYGRYNTHYDLPKIEVMLYDEALRKTLYESIPVMVYRGTQNLDDPAYVFRPVGDACSSMQDFIVSMLKAKYGVTCKPVRMWDVSTTTAPSINPGLPSVTGNGTVGSGGVGGQVGGGGAGGPLAPSIPAQPVALATNFDQRQFALCHSLPIGMVPQPESSSTSNSQFGRDEIITNPGGEAEANLPSDDPAMNGAPRVYDADCVADVHASVTKFIDVLTWAAEAEIVTLADGKPRFQVGTQYCAEDILSDLRAGLVQGGKFTVMFQPIWVAKKYDIQTLQMLRDQTTAKRSRENNTADMNVQLDAQLAAIDSTINGLEQNEHLFIDMKDPVGDKRPAGGRILPINGCHDEADMMCVASGSTPLTSCPSIENPQMFAFAGCFEYVAEINRFTCKLVKIYHTESDELVQAKLWTLRDQICKGLEENTNAAVLGDNRPSSHFG